MMATAHPNHALISSEDVEGTKVFDKTGTKIGDVDHLIIDKISGRVIYVVVSFGGFLSLGHGHYPLPWEAFSYDTVLEGFRTDVSEQQVHDAPEFSDDAWQSRDWERRVYEHYDVPPYWGR